MFLGRLVQFSMMPNLMKMTGELEITLDLCLFFMAMFRIFLNCSLYLSFGSLAITGIKLHTVTASNGLIPKLLL